MSTISHFDISADDLERAKNFYKNLSDWKIYAAPGMKYYLIQTTRE